MRGKKTRVRCVETGEEFGSLSEAADYCYGTRNHIWRALSGRSKTAYGYHWEYV